MYYALSHFASKNILEKYYRARKEARMIRQQRLENCCTLLC